MRNDSKDPMSVRERIRQTNGDRPGRFRVESLEQRLLLSWGAVPPANIAVPRNSIGVNLDSQGDAQGWAWIARNEVDFYDFVAPRSGSYRVGAQTPSSNLDTVLAVFDATGRQIAHNDDSLPGVQTDSDLTVTLQAGNRYFFGITNYIRTGGGSYVWLVNGPGSAL